MSDHRHDTLVVVFGACGRLGSRLLPLLAAGPWVVVAVARTAKPASRLPSVHWIQIDVTATDLWERSLRVFRGMADFYDRVIVVDLILDKSSVTAMRRSLRGGTAYVSCLSARLDQAQSPLSLILASTTAALAPRIYQTPYGMAKRRQLRRYAASGIPGSALLLPQLLNENTDISSFPAGAAWRYSEAALAIVRMVSAARAATPLALSLVVPHTPESTHMDSSTGRPAVARRLAELVTAHVISWTSHRDRPQVRRRASHARLDMTPAWLRARVDHHLVPAGLVRRLARRCHIDVREHPATVDGCDDANVL